MSSSEQTTHDDSLEKHGVGGVSVEFDIKVGSTKGVELLSSVAEGDCKRRAVKRVEI